MMREVFEVAELVKIGLEDERSGVAFYSRMAEKATSPDLKKLFADLADQERFHQKRFEEMLSALGDYKPHEQYPGEYMEYLNTLTRNRAFPDAETALKTADECADDAEALEVASRFERDTLILMNEMRSLVPEKDRPIVDELTREEQSHLVVLADARAKLSK